MARKNEIIPASNNSVAPRNENIKYPGDKMVQEMMPGGDIVTRLDTKERKATHRQYMKKDGTPGKQTVIFVQPDD